MADDKYAGWRKSTYSNSSANCVEVATGQGMVGVRDSKQEGRGPVLEFAGARWREFLRAVRAGEAGA
ncbi:MAG: DUF397 domain-containing protein [Actinobacteria bacterium]|nr:DUF397 domain-containing protein [Actinomycetota bacterium]MBO0787199.1 DUF397 domain-containing protein [Actinomycetota bacterium]